MARLRPRLTFSNVVSVIALFVALGGGAYAAVKLKPNQVKSKHIAPDAVRGVDANESSFGQVPSAANAVTAQSAATASDADTLGGLAAGELIGQGGNGFDDAIAGFLDEDKVGGIVVFEGVVAVHCTATPELVYADIGGDPFETDLWVDGAHQEVPDGGITTPGFPLTAAGDTSQVHIWGGGGTVADVLASAVWDGSGTECRVAFTSQENLDTGFAARSAPDRGRADLSRGGLPEGWVTPSPDR